MQNWVKEVPADEIADSVSYFVGRIRNRGDAYHESCSFIGRGLDGKMQWTQKPGIALKVLGSDLRAELQKNPTWSAIAIPDDAEKRWRARQPALRGINY